MRQKLMTVYVYTHVYVCVLVSGPPRRTSSFLVQRGPAGDNSPLVALQQAHSLAVSEWKASHVLAWLEYDMNMAAYGQACFDNVKSGKVSSHSFLPLHLPVLQTRLYM